MPSPADGPAPAIFLDGRSALRHAATVRLAPPVLLIETPEGTSRWPLSAIRVIGRDGGATRLACGREDARLLLDTAEAAALLAALRAFAPPRRTRARVAALAAATLLLAGALWFGGPLLADGAALLVPRPAARAIGDMAVRQVTLGAPACMAPDGKAALDGLVARLAAGAGIAAPEVTVVDRPEVNAFAVPGGRILVLRGLLARAGDADEVAGVLAHEIGHLRHDHPLRGLMRAVGLGALAMVLTGGSDVAGLAATLVSLANTRAFEAEADAEAVRILAAAGIGTAGFRRFFARMERGEMPDALRYLSSHPPTGERLSAIPDQPGQPALTPEAWAALRRIC